MVVSAKIKAGSAVDKSWRHFRRVGGDVSGVRFRLTGGEFIAKEIPAGSVHALLNNPSVTVDFMTEPVDLAKSYVEIETTTMDSDIDHLLGTPLTEKSRGRPRKIV